MKTIKVLAERMRNEGVQRAVMVVQTNMTPFAKQCLQEMQPKYYIELVSVGVVAAARGNQPVLARWGWAQVADRGLAAGLLPRALVCKMLGGARCYVSLNSW